MWIRCLMSVSSYTIVFLYETHTSTFHDSKNVVSNNHYFPHRRLPGPLRLHVIETCRIVLSEGCFGLLMPKADHAGCVKGD